MGKGLSKMGVLLLKAGARSGAHQCEERCYAVVGANKENKMEEMGK